MLSCLNRLRPSALWRAAVSRAAVLPAAQAAAQAAGTTALADAADTVIASPPAGAGTSSAAATEPPDLGRTCGWFDSSLDLRQGLAVRELAEPDWTVMALWFGPAALRQASRPYQRGAAL